MDMFSVILALTPGPSPKVGRGESSSLPSALGEGLGMGASRTLNSYVPCPIRICKVVNRAKLKRSL